MGSFVVALVLVLIVPLAIAGAIFVSVNQMRSPERLFEPVQNPDSAEQREAIALHHDWAVAHGFEPSGAYLFQQRIFLATWQNSELSTFLCVYSMPNKTVYDLVTLFEKDSAITTTNTSDAFTLPKPPGVYIQAFPGLELDPLWQHHVEARDYLWRCFACTVRTSVGPLLDEIVQAISAQIRYVTSLPLWPLRGIYWYFVTRPRMAHRTIQQQYPHQ